MAHFTKNLEIEWRILIVAAIMLLAFALPLQQSFVGKFHHTLSQSIDTNLETLLRSCFTTADASQKEKITASLERNRQWQALLPLIIDEQKNALLGMAGLLFVTLILLAFWSVKGLTRPLRTLASAAETIGKGDAAIVQNRSGGALGKLEKAMAKMQEELTVLRRQAHYEGMESAWRDIARVMAHEIKNPLTPIQLTIDRIQEKLDGDTAPDRDELRRFVERIGSQTAQLEHLVNDFRSFAREPEVRLKPVSVAKCVRETAGDFTEKIDTVIEGDARVMIDPYLMEQVLLNLYKNALEASAAVMKAAIIQNENTVTLELKDDGCGIPPEHMERIWIPYVTFKKGGTGLGLPVVKRILESMDASVSLESSTGASNHGVTVLIQFRIHTGEDNSQVVREEQENVQ